ncbi:MAG: AbrB/MazE/SpoVT family DNA-binding domain-containing protein [archaeon]
MKRKIIKQGHNTLTVTLPSDWAKSLNIKAGDEIDVVEKENTLVINGNHTQTCKKAVIDIRDFSIPMLWRYFQSAYRAGCDEIKIIYDPKSRKYEDAYHYYTTQFDYAKFGEKTIQKPVVVMIREVMNRFVGMEIVETGEDYCVVKEMGDITTKEFDNTLRRIFLIVMQLFERIGEAVDKNQVNDPGLCKEIHSIDLTIDKFVDYCSRILNKIDLNIPSHRKPLIFSSLFMLEMVGDEFKYIGKHMALAKKPVKEVLPLFKKVREHFEQYYHLYYTFSREKAIEFGNKDIEVYQFHSGLKENMRGESKSMMKHMMTISKFTLALVELRIEMEF